MTDYKVKVEHVLDAEFCSTILITAFDGQYGGSWYWAGPSERDWLEVNPADQWMSVLVAEREGPSVEGGPATYHITHEIVMEGIRKILLGGVIRQDLEDQVRRSVAENEADCDADASDAIIQMGALGSITYG